MLRQLFRLEIFDAFFCHSHLCEGKDAYSYRLVLPFFSMFLSIRGRLPDKIFNVQNSHIAPDGILICPSKLPIFCLNVRQSINFDIHFSELPWDVSRTKPARSSIFV